MEKTLFLNGFNFALICGVIIGWCIWLYIKIKPFIVKRIWNIPFVYYQPNINSCNDCSIRAFSKIFNCSWNEAFDIISIGAKHRHLNMSCETVLLDLLENNDYKSIYIGDKKYSFCKVVKRLESISGLGGVPYAIFSSDHMCACMDGKLYDSWDSRTDICTWLVLPKSVIMTNDEIKKKLKVG